MSTTAASLSRVRTVVLCGLLVVWFTEMTITSVRPLSEWWTHAWKMSVPEDRQLATALYLTHALEGAAKGALAVLAVFALRSERAGVRAALFIPMAVVPPLNLAFPIRAYGFLMGPTLIASGLSLILWNSFFLFREHDPPPSGKVTAPNRLAWARDTWFIVNALVLTRVAVVLLLAPEVAVKLAFPCLAGFMGVLGKTSPVTLTTMAVGSHVAAVAIATWIAVVYGRRYPLVRSAVSVASAVNAALLSLVPFTQLALSTSLSCASASVLVYALPLLAGWLIYHFLFGALPS